MDNTQRGIGIIYTIFSSWAFVSVLINRSILSAQLFGYYDIITIFCIVFFLLSIFICSTLFKIIQVSLIFIVAIAILFQGEMYLPLALFINIFFILYAYGFFNKHSKIKMVIFTIVLYSIYFISIYNKKLGPLYQVNVFVFIVAHIASLFIIFKSTVSKAIKFETSKEMQLNNKIDEMTNELHKTQEKLVDAVASGLELLEMIKDMKNGKR